MAITPVPSMSDTPPFPALADRATGTYNSKAYAFGAHMADTFNAELLAVAGSVEANATDAAASVSVAAAQVALATMQANAAAASTTAAAAIAGASAWAAGPYAINAAAISQINFQTYRKQTALSATTIDPAIDPPNWVPLGGSSAWMTKTANYTAASGDRIRADTATVGAWSCTLPASPADGDQIEIMDIKGSFAANNLSLIGNGKTIMGYATLILNIKYLHRIFTYSAALGDWRI